MKEHDIVESKRIIDLLARILSGIKDIRVAIVFGSVARGGKTLHDIDIAILPSRDLDLLELGNIISTIAGSLGVREDYVDVVDLRYVNPIMLSRILKEGIVVKGSMDDLKELYKIADKACDALIELKLWSTMDPEPKPDKAILVSRVEEIRRNVRFIKDWILAKGLDELDYRDKLALERALHRIIEAMLDVCRHLVSIYSLGLVDSYGKYAWRLAEAGIMPKNLATKVSKLAGLRNILVHRYIEIRYELLYKAAKEIAERISMEFIEWVKRIDPD